MSVVNACRRRRFTDDALDSSVSRSSPVRLTFVVTPGIWLVPGLNPAHVCRPVAFSVSGSSLSGLTLAVLGGSADSVWHRVLVAGAGSFIASFRACGGFAVR